MTKYNDENDTWLDSVTLIDRIKPRSWDQRREGKKKRNQEIIENAERLAFLLFRLFFSALGNP
jgi:hypothetical protein